MPNRKPTSRVTRTFSLAAALGALALGVHAIAPSLVATPSVAAAPACTAAAAQTAAPSGMTIGPIKDLNQKLPAVPTGALMVPASGGTPAYCLVTGSIVTNPGTGKTANVGLALPLTWNRKFLFTGCGGYCGMVFQTPPGIAHGGYPADALAKGYAIAATDDGHASTPAGLVFDASWALTPAGMPDTDAVTDFFYRAVHTVTAVGKQFAQRWYSGEIARSYYVGCSDGGREGMVEATRYPDDFDGIIAGDPFFDVPGQVLAGRAAKALTATPDSYIPTTLLRVADSAVYASCDTVDGAKDDLIQNPGRCAFRPENLLCRQGDSANCLTQQHLATLNTWFSAAKDTRGRVVSLGFPVSDFYDDTAKGNNVFAWTEAAGPPRNIKAAEPWGDSTTAQPGGWAFYDQSFKYLVFRDSQYDNNNHSPVNSLGVVNDSAMTLLEARTEAGRGDSPRKLAPFLASNRKLIMYHGYSDGFINPFRTVRFYQDWAQLAGGQEALARSARLFMVPGMYQCGGGPGPNIFDALGALERWVEQGHAPETIVATKYANDSRTQSILRTMPLCPFPTQARRSNAGDVKRAEGWSCAPNDELLQAGPNGKLAGLTGPER